MAVEDNRIKIRELPASDVSGDDVLAVAKHNIEKTVQATIYDVVKAGMTIEAGAGITVTPTDTGVRITGTAEFDDSSIQSALSDLQAQIDALKNVETPSVKAQPTPPTGAATGDLWWDTNTANMYIRYNGAWVQSNGGGGGGGSAEIADTDAPGVVAPNSSFKVGHSGNMTLNSRITIPTLDRSDSSGNNTRPRWQPNTSYFKGQHFRGPDINGNDASWGTPIKNNLYVTTRAYTSSNNFINDMNAKKHFVPGSSTGKGIEGGQISIKNPDNADMVIDSFKDVHNWFGRGTRNYIRIHDNTALGYQLLFDPFPGGGAWLAHSPDLKPGQSTGALIPWGGGGGTVHAMAKVGGNGTVKKSSGVKKVVRNGHGSYTVTLSTPCPDTNYVVMLTQENGHPYEGNIIVTSNSQTKDSFSILSVNDNSAIRDPAGFFLVVYK